MSHLPPPLRESHDEGSVTLLRFVGAITLLFSCFVCAVAVLMWMLAAPNGGSEDPALFLAGLGALGAAAGSGALFRRKWGAFLLMALMDLTAVAFVDFAISGLPSAPGLLLGYTFAHGALVMGSIGALAWRQLQW